MPKLNLLRSQLRASFRELSYVRAGSTGPANEQGTTLKAKKGEQKISGQLDPSPGELPPYISRQHDLGENNSHLYRRAQLTLSMNMPYAELANLMYRAASLPTASSPGKRQLRLLSIKHGGRACQKARENVRSQRRK